MIYAEFLWNYVLNLTNLEKFLISVDEKENCNYNYIVCAGWKIDL